MSAQITALQRLGHTLASWRVSRMWTQEAAAEACGVSVRQWARYERGEQAMGVDVLARIARHLDKATCDAAFAALQWPV